MGTPFIVENYGTIDDATALEAQRRKNRLDPFYYLAKNVDDLAALKAQRLQTAMKVTSADMLTKNASNIDLVLYAIDHPSVQALIASNGDRQLNNRDWFWWTASQSDAHLNRLYSGFLLWKCNVYGAMASDYQTAFGTDPFDDTLVPTGANAPYRPQMLTYPAQGGLISTIQWEGMREGVTDVRFLTTFFAAWRECKDNHLVPDLLKQYDADVRGFLAGPLQTLTEDELQQGRLMIATRAQKLRSTVDAYYVTHPLMGSVRPAPKPKP
jgi:hypothetical protein